MVQWQKNAFKAFGLKMTRMHLSKRKAFTFKQASQRIHKHALDHLIDDYCSFRKKYNIPNEWFSWSDFKKGGKMAKQMKKFVVYLARRLEKKPVVRSLAQELAACAAAGDVVFMSMSGARVVPGSLLSLF